MLYSKIEPIQKEEAKRIFEGTDPEKIVGALLSIAYHDPDFEWVQSQCLRFIDSADKNVKRIAILCLGHIARIHKKVDTQIVIPLLKTLLDDEVYGGTASDALDDIRVYTGQK